MRRIYNPEGQTWEELDQILLPATLASRAHDVLSAKTGNYNSWRYEAILKERTQDFKAFRAYPSDSTPQKGAWVIKVPRDNEMWKNTLDSRVKSQYLKFSEGYATSEFDNILDYVQKVGEKIPEDEIIGIARVEHIDEDGEFFITQYAPGETYGDLNQVRFDALKHLSWTLGRLNGEGIFLADFHNDNFVIDANKAYIVDQAALAVVEGMTLDEPMTTNLRDVWKVLGQCEDHWVRNGAEYTAAEMERCFYLGFAGEDYLEDYEL